MIVCVFIYVINTTLLSNENQNLAVNYPIYITQGS